MWPGSFFCDFNSRGVTFNHITTDTQALPPTFNHHLTPNSNNNAILTINHQHQRLSHDLWPIEPQSSINSYWVMGEVADQY